MRFVFIPTPDDNEGSHLSIHDLTRLDLRILRGGAVSAELGGQKVALTASTRVQDGIAGRLFGFSHGGWRRCGISVQRMRRRMFIYTTDLGHTLMRLSRSWRKAKHSNLVSELPFSVSVSTSFAFEHHMSTVNRSVKCDGFFNYTAQ